MFSHPPLLLFLSPLSLLFLSNRALWKEVEREMRLPLSRLLVPLHKHHHLLKEFSPDAL